MENTLANVVKLEYGIDPNSDNNGVPYTMGNRHERRKMAAIMKIRQIDPDRVQNMNKINEQIKVYNEIVEKAKLLNQENNPHDTKDNADDSINTSTTSEDDTNDNSNQETHDGLAEGSTTERSESESN